MTARPLLDGPRPVGFALAALCLVILACGGDDGPASGGASVATPAASATPSRSALASPVASATAPTTIVTTAPPATPAATQAPPATAAGPQNLVMNPSFEDQAGWRLVRSDAPDAPPLLDQAVRRTGQSAARIDHFAAGNCPAVCGYWSPPISVTPGRQYEIGAWFRLGETLIGQSGIYVTVRVPDSAGNYQPLFGYPTGARTGDWTLASRMLMLPAPVTSIVIDISWWRNIDFPNATGTIWLDDVFLR